MTVTAPSSLISSGARPPARPVSRLGCRLVELARALHHDQYQLVVTAAAFADSGERAADGASSAGAWLAAVADVEPCTAREWIRIGRQLKQLPVSRHPAWALRWPGGVTATTAEPRSTPITTASARCVGAPTPTG